MIIINHPVQLLQTIHRINLGVIHLLLTVLHITNLTLEVIHLLQMDHHIMNLTLDQVMIHIIHHHLILIVPIGIVAMITITVIDHITTGNADMLTIIPPALKFLTVFFAVTDF